MSEYQIFVSLDDEATAADAINRRIPMPRGLGHSLEAVELVPQKTSTAHASNHATITVKDSDGNTLASRTTDSGSGSTLTGGTSESLSLSGDRSEETGGYWDVDVAKGGTGVSVNVGVMLTIKRSRVIDY